VESLPSWPTGVLIGKIGDKIFNIGKGRTIYSSEGGKPYLSINDNHNGLYVNDESLCVGVSK
jgi:hypothetical protein